MFQLLQDSNLYAGWFCWRGSHSLLRSLTFRWLSYSRSCRKMLGNRKTCGSICCSVPTRIAVNNSRHKSLQLYFNFFTLVTKHLLGPTLTWKYQVRRILDTRFQSLCKWIRYRSIKNVLDGFKG